jgi:hypothetical protein
VSEYVAECPIEQDCILCRDQYNWDQEEQIMKRSGGEMKGRIWGGRRRHDGGGR